MGTLKIGILIMTLELPSLGKTFEQPRLIVPEIARVHVQILVSE